MNKVILCGRLTADPVKRVTQNGKDSATFTVACTRNFKNANGDYDADFINCVAWGGTAVFVSNYFKKGSGIHAVGSIQTRKYDKDGEKRYATEVNVSEVEFCGAGQKTEKKKEADDIFNDYIPTDDEECPF